MTPALDTREKLMQTATGLIWQSSYDHVGIAEICKQAGVTKGAFYHHFCSKAELFVCACEYEWQNVSLALDEALSPRFSAIEQLGNFIAAILNKHHHGDDGDQIYGCPFFTSGAQAGCEDKMIRKASYNMSEKGVAYFEALTRNLQAGDYLQNTVDPQQKARLLQQYFQGAMMHGRIYQDIEALRSDLREGSFQVLGVKPEFRSLVSLLPVQEPKRSANA